MAFGAWLLGLLVSFLIGVTASFFGTLAALKYYCSAKDFDASDVVRIDEAGET